MTTNKRRIAYLFTLLLLIGNFGPAMFAMQQKPEDSSAVLTQREQQDSDEEAKQEICVICREEFGSQEVESLSCSHKFHVECLVDWVVQCEQNHCDFTCPLCRRKNLFIKLLAQRFAALRGQSAGRVMGADGVMSNGVRVADEGLTLGLMKSVVFLFCVSIFYIPAYLWTSMKYNN